MLHFLSLLFINAWSILEHCLVIVLFDERPSYKLFLKKKMDVLLGIFASKECKLSF